MYLCLCPTGALHRCIVKGRVGRSVVHVHGCVVVFALGGPEVLRLWRGQRRERGIISAGFVVGADVGIDMDDGVGFALAGVCRRGELASVIQWSAAPSRTLRTGWHVRSLHSPWLAVGRIRARPSRLHHHYQQQRAVMEWHLEEVVEGLRIYCTKTFSGLWEKPG